ncbi:threonine/serine exporter family protein [Hyphomicrobiales bacterium BP6-180914]|uniref:Threonine/serine exporter family protein n=2 Tax=Lichenifustis flavocetrariae TaxID=2949735 RepID=A0AA42CQU6_9HYPH|nr:threonine/serine exporter family protein [Lichenifustis flavocetrariae]
MVLVPGPHILNGAFDLLALRIPLAASRLAFAVLVLFAIGVGLLAGLALAGGELPAFEPGRSVAVWVDVPAAAIVAMCYGVFYSMPVRMLVWPAAAGAVAHAAHWWAMATFGLSAATATGVAALVAATILLPAVRRYRLPFAGVGFASVVSLLPGVFVFRLMSGAVQIAAAGSDIPPRLLDAVLADAVTAFAIVLAMALGLAIPKQLYETLSPGASGGRAPT